MTHPDPMKELLINSFRRQAKIVLKENPDDLDAERRAKFLNDMATAMIEGRTVWEVQRRSMN